MLTTHFIQLGFLILAGTAAASPIRRDSADCTEYDQAGMLLNYDGGQQTKIETATVGQTIKLVETNSTDEQFQFFQCSAPSDDFYGSGSSKPKPDQPEYFAYGQLRSTRYPGQCVTAGNVQDQSNSTNTDKTSPYTTISPDSDGTLTIAPCQTDGSDITRRQWMFLNPYKDNQHSTDMCNHQPDIGHAGKINDAHAGGTWAILEYESSGC